ncbi:MAG: MarR family winged helix-turn-helix transcriptional regulator [Limnohabitans sp.]
MSEELHTAHLEALLGYNTRRAALHIIGAFMQNMAEFDLRPAEFSVLSLIRHNPGITSRQLCAALNILPPNLVVILKQFEKRGLIARKPHPTDGRAIGLSLTDKGDTLVAAAEEVSAASDLSSTQTLTAAERKTLTRLLQKIYLQA